MSKRSMASAFSPNKKKGDPNKGRASSSSGAFTHLGSQSSNSNLAYGKNDISPSRGARGNANGSVLSSSQASNFTHGTLGSQMPDLLVTHKIINDPIHTAVKLDRLSCRIVDTPQYQRLRQLKQLGTCSFVFPSAGHTRFEHSLGVAHLAERVTRKLQSNQPELGITDADILAVKISGLCHDLGHGPFSHVYDGVFIKDIYTKGLEKKNGNEAKWWRHEDGSVQMFRLILEANGIDLQQYGLSPQDQTFIEEIIGGEKEKTRKGRGPEKFYLYDIVNNTRSGLDVDKLDYFQRDMRYTNITLTANFERFIELGRVLRAVPVGGEEHGVKFSKSDETAWVPSQNQEDQVDGPSTSTSENGNGNGMISASASTSEEDTRGYQLMVCYPQKLVFEAIDMFSIRFRMHKQVYTHKAAKQVEFMITDVLKLADPFIKIKGRVTQDFPDGKYRISECVYDMEALSRLNDSVIEVIRYDDNPGLLPAKAVLERLEKRELYVCLGKSPYTRDDVAKGLVKSESMIEEELLEISKNLADGGYSHYRNISMPSEDQVLPTEVQAADSDMQQSEFMDHGFSQDSFYSVTQMQNSQGIPEWVPLEKDDIIVERMHIHYGMKDRNPVSRLRFFTKGASRDTVGEPVKDRIYQTSMPVVFEEFAVRVFCRTQGKESSARRAFQIWCKEKLSCTPFQTEERASEMMMRSPSDLFQSP